MGKGRHSSSTCQEAEHHQLRDCLRPYLTNTPEAKKVLDPIETEGYVVLPGIFSVEEADNEYRRMWDWIQTVVPSIRRNDPSTWRARGKNDAWPCSQRDMMQLHQAGWVFSDMREAMASRVFETIYGTKALHSSKDGFTLQRPTEEEMDRSPNDHYDQGFAKRGLQCIQGSVALTDQENEDGCFLCWPGSHRFHDEMMDARGPGGAREDFIILNQCERVWLREKGIEPKRVPVKRGDVILWRSDLVHKGAPPVGKRDNFRGVVYICMLPAVLTPDHVYKQKREAYEQLQTGCHWPNREEWFHPRRHNAVCRPYFNRPPQLTLRQKQLYGLERYSAEAVSSTAVTSGSAFVGRRWGRSHPDAPAPGGIAAGYPVNTMSSAAPAETAQCLDGAPQSSVATSSTKDNQPNLATLDERRLRKALREIEQLERRQDSGECLRGNQLEKIARKHAYEHELQLMGALQGVSGGA